MVGVLDLLFFYLGADGLHLVYHLPLFLLECGKLISLRLHELCWDFKIAEFFDLIAASLEHGASLHQSLLYFLPELSAIKISTKLPVIVFKSFDLLLNRLELCFNLLLLLFALASRQRVGRLLLVTSNLAIGHALGSGFIINSV